MNTNWEDHCSVIEFDGRKWLWPNIDHKLQQVNDWVNDLTYVLEEMDKARRQRGVVVQAGGACGVWPVALAEIFDEVVTFEPDPLNYYCLETNTIGYYNIDLNHAALGEEAGSVFTKLPPSEMNNVGAYYTMDATQLGGVTREYLDNIPFVRLDLLCLDIEGREIEAIRGAYNTIEQHQPFIMIEEKQLPQMGLDIKHKLGEATKWLEKRHGYKVVNKIHRDVILAPPE